ncbi:hypothetical protein HMPREF0322_01137 [Desulfitobacterium hafniense DP7]|uniref:Uncharacterized protein n=1 Tax=Desulfitobacterium hafniense DP7 TaxID=537010 RepID=G9XJK6_DESHA|nr:hypothetical protein HMPREF0322_01137 [Desulfitobacterium hafniense DP7]
MKDPEVAGVFIVSKGQGSSILIFKVKNLPADGFQSFIPGDPLPLPRKAFALAQGVADPLRAVYFMNLIHNFGAKLAPGIGMGRIALDGDQPAMAGGADYAARVITISGTDMMM